MATMAASHMTASLDVVAPDDDMEISSDAGRTPLYDLDIDLPDPRDDDEEIDYMIDDEADQDTHQQVHESSKDDIMVDDYDEPHVVETEMRDDEPVPDEHLTDANELPNEDTQNDFEDQLTFQTQEPIESDLLDLDGLDNDAAQVPEIVIDNPTTEFASSADPAPVFTEDSQPSQPTSANQTSLPLADNELAAPSAVDYNLDHDIRHDEPYPHEDEGRYNDEEQVADGGEPSQLENSDVTNTQISSEEPAAEAIPAVDSDVLAVIEQETAASPLQSYQDGEENTSYSTQSNSVPTHEQGLEDDPNAEYQLLEPAEDDLEDESAWTPTLHAVKVQYGPARLDNDDSNSLFLFQGQTGSFIIEDEAVAYNTMSELFQSCRHTLSDVGEDKELEIYCVDLDLCISEVCVSCLSTSSLQILTT
jgi:hypothetical protein